MTGLVLLHGFTGSGASFDELLPQLAKLGWAGPLLRPSLLGHGAAPAPRVLRFEQEVDRLAAEIRRAGFSGAHLCGYSLGARLGLGLLGRHASLFRSATLVGVHPGLSDAAERAARVGSDERWCELLSRQGMAGFLRAWEAQPLFETQRALAAPQRERQRQIRQSHSADGLMQALRVLGLGQMPDYRGVLPAVALPVRLLVGSRDSKFEKLAQDCVAACGRIDLVRVEGAGHNLPLEAPVQLARVLTQTLEDRV
ncbi:MAG TPA: alpha/beta fold hydrolase [Polyangiaceae bacterium]|nr:alpha/beta fold hydrolase [Polyangiaceae bacterium]